MAAHAVGLDSLRPVMYSLRHTGASSDILNRRRTLEEVKRRGAWPSDLTVKKYEKHARALAQMARLPPAVQRHAVYCHAHLGELLQAPHLAPAPPAP